MAQSLLKEADVLFVGAQLKFPFGTPSYRGLARISG